MSHLTPLIRDYEDRIKRYKTLLIEIRETPITEENKEVCEWFRNMVRDAKNDSELILKALIREKTCENQGMDGISAYR